MYNSKLIRIFQSFDKAEKAGLRRWINSPAHNQHSDVKNTIDFLLKKRKITPTSVKRARLHDYLYPNQTYNPARINHVLSFTTEVVEGFIAFLMIQKSPFQAYLSIGQYYQQKNLKDLATSALKKTKTALQQDALRDELYYYNNFLLEKAQFNLTGTENRQQRTNLQEIFNDLGAFTIIATLRNACIALSHKSLYKTDYQIPFLEATLQESQISPYKDNLVIQTYFHSYQALKTPEEEKHFHALKPLLLERQLPLTTEDLKYITLLSINYCIKRLNTGSEQFVQEVFELYQFGLEQEIWLENGALSHSTFKNIATAALRLKEYDWTANFIEDYSHKIKPKYRVDYTNYIKAKLLFEQADYSQAQDLLLQTELVDLFIGLAIKILLLKIYWKLEEYSLLEAHMDSFAVYLNRKKVLAYHRQIYGNTISITRKIVHANLNDSAVKQQLHQLIMNTHPLTERPWLLEQLEK